MLLPVICKSVMYSMNFSFWLNCNSKDLINCSFLSTSIFKVLIIASLLEFSSFNLSIEVVHKYCAVGCKFDSFSFFKSRKFELLRITSILNDIITLRFFCSCSCLWFKMSSISFSLSFTFAITLSTLGMSSFSFLRISPLIMSFKKQTAAGVFDRLM